MERFYTYVLLCDDGSLYKGHCSNIEERYNRHCAGFGAKHTKKHKPLKIVLVEEFQTEQEAIKRERYLKSGIGREWLKDKLNGMPACRQAGRNCSKKTTV
jgi:predicted GIY-YIG superfamily endonuclease